MLPLTVALVEKNVATRPEVERALARQTLYGSDLATSLIEVAAIDEGNLIRAVSEVLQLEPAALGELPRASTAAQGIIPKDIAVRLGVVALERTADALVVAVSEPLPQNALTEIGRVAGAPVSQRYAPAPRIRQALSRDYDVPLDRRNQRVLARLHGQPDPLPSLAPPPISDTPHLSSLPRPPTLPPIGLPAADLGPTRLPAPSPVPAPEPPPEERASEPPPQTEPVWRHPTQKGFAAASQPPPAPVRVSRRPTPTGTRQLPEINLKPPTMPGFATQQAPMVEPASPTAPAVQPSMATQGAGTGARPMSMAPKPRKTPSPKALGRSADKHKPKRHRGPYTAALAEEDLRQAAATSEVLRAFFDFAAQYFEYSALFAVHGDIAEGREASGPGRDRIGITDIGVPLDIPSSMARARDQNKYLIERLDKHGLDKNLASDLIRSFEARSFLLPISVRGRCVVLFYGDEGRDDVALSEIGDVLALAPLVASSLERILVQRKRARDSDAPGFAPVQRPRFAAPSKAQRASALASALDLAALSPAGENPSAQANRRHTPMVSTPLPPKPQPTPWIGLHPTPTVPSKGPQRKGTMPLLSLADARPAVEDDWEIPDDPMPAQVKNSSLRPPRRSSTPGVATELPKSALLEQQLAADALVEELLQGEERAEKELVALGVSAAAQVISRFPGPLQGPIDLKRPASAQGVILRTLVRLGEPAAPFVVARTGDADPAIRSWATLLLAELPFAASYEAICRRLLDHDADVARTALRSCQELAKQPATRPLITEALTTLLAGSAISDEDRFAIVQVLVELKLETAVPRLLRMLGSNPQVVQPAQWALRALACQDFGDDGAAWQSWWSDHRTQSRVEWLVEALAHGQRELRQNAFAELRELAHRDFGYRETLSPEQVRDVQRRYLEWWKQSGKTAAP